MKKVALSRSMSKRYLSMKQHIRRNKKLVSSAKLVFVSVIFMLVLGVYAKEINEWSTAGFFLKQEMKAYENLTFDLDIVELDILMKEKQLRDSVDQAHATWYNHTDRIIYVPTFTESPSPR
jgi:hypothetical protein